MLPGLCLYPVKEVLHFFSARKLKGGSHDGLWVYKVQAFDTRDLGSRPETNVCSGGLKNKRAPGACGGAPVC